MCKRTFSLYTLLGVLIVALCGCVKPVKGSGSEQERISFEMSPSPRNLLIENVKKLQLGMTADEAKALLGQSDYDQISLVKETGEFGFRCLTYYVYMYDIRFVNEKDRLLELYFDSENRLVNMNSNIQDFEKSPDGFEE